METTFFDIVKNSGTIGIICWIAIFTMWPVGIVLGIISLIAASYRTTRRIPSSFKILIITLVIYLFIGALGTIQTSILSSEAIKIATGAEKATRLALGISNSLYLLAFTFLNTIPFMFFIFISILILHFKELPMTLEELMALDEEQS